MVIQGTQLPAPQHNRLQRNRQRRNRRLHNQHQLNQATAMQNAKVKVLWPIQTIAGTIYFQLSFEFHKIVLESML